MSAELKGDNLFFMSGNRIGYREYFVKKPGLHADKAYGTPTNAQVIAGEIANSAFGLSGTNMTSALATFSTNAGVTLTTAGASADQALLGPNTSTNESVWNNVNFPTDNSLRFECLIKTPATIANLTLFAGLKLTSTPVSATDANQIFVRYDDATNSGKFQVLTTRSSTLSTFNGSTALAASTLYRISIELDADRRPTVSVNNLTQVDTSQTTLQAPLTTGINLKPFLGIQATTSAARAFDVIYVELSKTIS